MEEQTTAAARLGISHNDANIFGYNYQNLNSWRSFMLKNVEKSQGLGILPAPMVVTAVERMLTKANFGRPFRVEGGSAATQFDEDPKVSLWVSFKVNVAAISYDLEALAECQVIELATAQKILVVARPGKRAQFYGEPFSRFHGTGLFCG